MTYLTSTQPSQPLSFFTRAITNFFENRKTRIAQKQTVFALNNLDNRALKDLAICRSEIYSVSYASSIGRRRTWSQ